MIFFIALAIFISACIWHSRLSFYRAAQPFRELGGHVVAPGGDGAEVLIAGGAAIRTISLRNTNVSDTDLKELQLHLESFPNLFTVDLSNTQITDVGLDCLHGVSNLFYLDVRGTQVTTQGIDALKKTFPKCDVRHSLR